MGATGKKKSGRAVQATGGWSLNGWPVCFFLAGVLIAGAGQLAFRLLRSDGQSATMFPAESRATAASEAAGATSAQPWGNLEITPLVLERPEEMFDSTTRAIPGISWLFPNHSPEQLVALIQSCDLTDAQKASLLDTNRWRREAKGWSIMPPMDLVGDLTEAAREKIYSVLGQFPENPQFYPFTCLEDRFDELTVGCELSREKIALLRKLCYRKRGLLYFADGQYFELTSSSNETRCMFRTLLRVPTMLVKLHITADSDIDALVDYWGAGGRAKELRPLLHSLARVPGGSSVNISQLLPALPRLNLYTYPPPTGGARRDCFWTSFNFFGERPDYRLGDVKYADELLRSDYTRWLGEKAFGDLLVLTGGNFALHACIYIAGDIYYTKNGTDPNQPWVLMEMRDIMAQYPSDGPREWRVYRKKAT